MSVAHVNKRPFIATLKNLSFTVTFNGGAGDGQGQGGSVEQVAAFGFGLSAGSADEDATQQLSLSLLRLSNPSLFTRPPLLSVVSNGQGTNGSAAQISIVPASGHLGYSDVEVVLYDSGGSFYSFGSTSQGQDTSTAYKFRIHIEAGYMAPVFRWRLQPPGSMYSIAILEAHGLFSRHDLVDLQDIMLYRNGKRAYDNFAFVLTSLNQTPNITANSASANNYLGQEAGELFELLPALSLDNDAQNRSMGVKLQFEAKATVHGSFYMTFTIVDTTISEEQRRLLPVSPNSTQQVHLSIVPVNSKPRLGIASNVTLPSNNASLPTHLANIIVDISAGAGDEDFTQTVSFKVTYAPPNSSCLSLFTDPPQVSFAGFPARTASLTVLTRPFRGGTCVLQITATDSAPDQLQEEVWLQIRVISVNRPPVFGLLRSVMLLVESSQKNILKGFVTHVSDGEEDASWPRGALEEQKVTFYVAAEAWPGNLFVRNPSIGPDGALAIELTDGVTGRASLAIRARDDGGKLFGGQDSSREQGVTIEVLARPRLSAMNPMWWMATEVAAPSFNFTISGTFFSGSRLPALLWMPAPVV
jgi:hypothetical protein